MIGSFVALALNAVLVIDFTPMLCDTKEVCTPPAEVQFVQWQPPNNVPVKYAGMQLFGKVEYWLWVKSGEAAQKCSASQLNSTSSNQYDPRCTAKVGDAMFVTQRFSSVEPPKPK